MRLRHGDRPYAIGFYDEHGNTAYKAWAVDPFTREVAIPPEDIEALQEFFGDEKREVVWHHAKYDVLALKMIGVEHRAVIHESMAAVYVVRGPRPSLRLKDLGVRFLDIPKDDESALRRATSQARRHGKTLGWKLFEPLAKKDDALAPDYWMVDPKRGGGEAVKTYCLKDCERALMLFMLFREIAKEEGLWELYGREMELWPVTWDMIERGCRVNRGVLAETITAQEARHAKLSRELVAEAPGVNLNSGKQLGEFLFGDPEKGTKGRGLECRKWTKTRQPKTDADTLEQYGDPFISKMIEARRLRKALDNYLHAYERLMVRDVVDPRVFVIHPSLNQFAAITGRYSCSEPNLQNLGRPNSGVPTEVVRGVMGPRPGYVWVLMDGSQIEVRIFADVSQEATMLRLIATGADVHSGCTNYAWGGRGNVNGVRQAVRVLRMGTGQRWEDQYVTDEVRAIRNAFGWEGDPYALGESSPERVAERWLAEHGFDIVAAEKAGDVKTTRSIAKQLLFLKLYGGGAGKAAAYFDGDLDAARTFIREYDRAFPQIKGYMRELIAEARERGYITTRYGRRVPVDPNFAYRAVNYMVQGSAAGWMRDSLLKAWRYLKRFPERDAHLVLTVHDELIVEVKREHATRGWLRGLKTEIEDHGGRFGVPIPVDCELVTSRWDQKRELKL